MKPKDIAESYFNRIPDGHTHAIQRPPLDTPVGRSVDRQLRAMINFANCNGDCIINVGRGIYRPLPDDEMDMAEYREYIKKDRSRRDVLNIKTASMEQTMKSRRKEIEYAKQQREREERRTGTCKDFEQLRLPM